MRAFVLAMLAWLHVGVAEGQLYAVVSDEGSGPDVGSLLELDPATGTIINRIPLTLSTGGSPEGIVGIAAHPVTRVLYVILDESPRELARVNPGTGVVTVIGSLGDYYCGLTFGSDGTLYAIAAQQHNVDPGAVYTVDPATGATTLFRASDDVLAGGFPDGGGQSIEINSDDGGLYFTAAFGSFDDLLRMNLGSKIAAPVALSDPLMSQAIAYEAASGTFLTWDEDNDEFLRVNPTTGSVTILNTNISEGNTIRGFELMPAQSGTPAPAIDGVGLAVTLLLLCWLGYHRIARAR